MNGIIRDNNNNYNSNYNEINECKSIRNIIQNNSIFTQLLTNNKNFRKIKARNNISRYRTTMCIDHGKYWLIFGIAGKLVKTIWVVKLP